MSVKFGPLDHYPGILERGTKLLDIQVQLRDRPNVTAVRLWASNHPHHLYGVRAGPPASGLAGAVPVGDATLRQILGRARKGQISRSFSLRRHTYPEVTRGIARFVVHMDDIAGMSEGSIMFLAIQQERAGLPVITSNGFTGSVNVIKGAVDTGDNILGPILVVPSVGQWYMPETTLVISGQAPNGSAAMGAHGTFPVPDLDLQIINPMHFVLPRPTTSITIRNMDAASALRVSFGLGQQIFILPVAGAGVASERTFFGAVKEVCLQSAGAALADFSIEANINLGGAAGGV